MHHGPYHIPPHTRHTPRRTPLIRENTAGQKLASLLDLMGVNGVRQLESNRRLVGSLVAIS